MTSYLTITTANEPIWQAHGRCMARTFCRHWPSSVPLRVYAEGFDAAPDDPPVEYVSLNAAVPWLATFKALYRAPQYNGGQNGRDYRHDAVRFAHKVAALGAAVEGADCDVLIWMDADIVTFERVTMEWLEELFPEPATIAWLDRDNCYPECGFMMFRMPAAQKLIRAVVKAYRNGAIFQLAEWHDSFVIHSVARSLGVKAHSLSGPEGRKHRAHPWVMSRLAEKMDHLKGEQRKAAGRSLQKDLIRPRSEPYWQWR